MRIARTIAVLAGLVVALCTSTANAPQALAAGDQFQDSAVSTYELQPSRGVIHVTMQITMANKKGSTSKSYSCTGYAYDPYYGFYSYTTTCTTRTNYYYNRAWYWVEKDAKSLKARASRGSISVKPGGPDGSWRKANLKFSGLYYGQSRKVTVQYDLPAGGPRSDAARRAGYAYTAFCVAGPGTDSGEVRIVVPAGFELAMNKPMKSRTAGGKTTYSSGKLKSSPWKFYNCVSGMNPTGGFASKEFPGTAGTVTVEAWKGDAAWADAATAAATEDLPKLEAVLGPRPGATDITIRESLALTTPPVSYDAGSGTLTVNEMTTDRASVADALTALWFPSDQFVVGWLKSGYINWAQHAAGISDKPCSKPGPIPGGGDPDLSAWQTPGVLATQDARDLFALKEQAACYIVTETAAAIGPEAMATALVALRDWTDAWSPENRPLDRATAVSTWRHWLDLVVERGVIPAGADPRLVADLLTTYGVAPDAGEVAAHETARAGWHALQDLTGGKAPAMVVAALAAWDDVTAQAAIDAANRAWTTVGAVEANLPDVDIDGGPVREAVIAATTQADLDAAVSMADQQVAMASDVADALAVLAAPRDSIQELGLMGTTLPDPAPAIEAVARVDGDAAADLADAIRSTIGGARDAGVQRAALAGGGLVVVVLLMVAGAVIVLRRRRHSRVAAVASPFVSGGPAEAPGGAPAPSAVDDAAPTLAWTPAPPVADAPAPAGWWTRRPRHHPGPRPRRRSVLRLRPRVERGPAHRLSGGPPTGWAQPRKTGLGPIIGRVLS